jgi:hypothetical protein
VVTALSLRWREYRSARPLPPSARFHRRHFAFNFAALRLIEWMRSADQSAMAFSLPLLDIGARCFDAS